MCVLCRQFDGTPFKTPPPSPRFHVKDDPAVPATTDNKVWSALYICFVTRAVHLDAVPDMSTQTFIRCLKWFATRRGLPRRFISDNSKTFNCAAKYIRTVFTDTTVKEQMGSEWIFNLPLVGRCKWSSPPSNVYARRSEEHTDELLAEIAVIHSRPLSYLSSEDVEEPLTLSHLLVGRRILNLPDHLGYRTMMFSVDPATLTGRMILLSEYLSELREAHYHLMQGTSKRDHTSITAGDVVIVYDEHLPWGLWKLGLVKDTIQGRDGEIRGATIKMVARREASNPVT